MSCIEAKTKLDDEQKKMLFRATAILLKNNGLTKSAHALLKETKIKIDSGAEPPDIEGIFLSFLRKEESDALEHKLQLNQLASSLEMMKLSISYDDADPEDVSIFSKYSSKLSEEELRLSSSPVEYLCDPYTIEMAGLHKLAQECDVFKFFRKASINPESVDFHGKATRDFRNVKRKSSTLRFRSVEDTKRALTLNGSFLEISIARRKRRGSHVFLARYANNVRVLCMTAPDEGALDEGARGENYLEYEVSRLCMDYRAIEFVDARMPLGRDMCYVIVKANQAFRDFLVGCGGNFFTLKNLIAREATLTGEAFEYLFPNLAN